MIAPRPTIVDIIAEVHRDYGIARAVPLRQHPPRRGRPVNESDRVARAVRDEVIRRAYLRSGMSYPEIARALGLRSHTAAMAAKRRADARLAAGSSGVTTGATA